MRDATFTVRRAARTGEPWRRPRLARAGERLVEVGLAASSLMAVGVTLLIVGILASGSVPFFQRVSVSEFLGSTRWAPLTIPQSYGVVALLADTLVIVAISLGVAVPFGILSAVFLTEFAGRLAGVARSLLELLAGIPTVVYGFFAVKVVTPALQATVLPQLGFWNGLSAGLVMGFMILPTVVSLTEELLRAVPGELREAAYALGATRYEAAVQVVLPAATSGIGAACILAMSRAVGETMIVALAAGRTPAWPPDPTQPMMALTTTIVNIATGDHEATAFIWSALFAIGLLLFCITLVLNLASFLVVRRFKERFG